MTLSRPRLALAACFALCACRKRSAHDAVALRAPSRDAGVTPAAPVRALEAVDPGSGPIVVGANYPAAGFSRVVALSPEENPERFDCEGQLNDATETLGARPVAPQAVLNVVDRPRRVRVWARGRGSYALVVGNGTDDSPRCAVQTDARGAALDLGTVPVGAHLDLWAASIDGGRLDVRLGVLTEDNPLPNLDPPPAPALTQGEVRGFWELRELNHDDGPTHPRLVLTGAVERVIDLADPQLGTCRGDPGVLPGFMCQIGGFATYGVSPSRLGGYEIRMSQESDGVCDGPRGEHVECPVERRTLSRFTLPAGTHLRTDPRGSLRYVTLTP